MGLAHEKIKRLYKYLNRNFPGTLTPGCNTIDEVIKLLDRAKRFGDQALIIRQALHDWDLINIISGSMTSKFKLKYTWFKKRLKILQVKKGTSFRDCLKQEGGRRYKAMDSIPIDKEMRGLLDEIKRVGGKKQIATKKDR